MLGSDLELVMLLNGDPQNKSLLVENFLWYWNGYCTAWPFPLALPSY